LLVSITLLQLGDYGAVLIEPAMSKHSLLWTLDHIYFITCRHLPGRQQRYQLILLGDQVKGCEQLTYFA